MSLLYVFAASPMEAEPVRKAATAESRTNLFRCGANEVLLLAGAMGPKGARDRAEGALVAPSNQRPDAVVIVGLCGGLTTDLPEERIVLYEACVSTDAGNRRLSFSSVLTKSVGDLLTSSNIRHERVTAITSPRIAINRAEKTALSKSGAQVVDMESYSILDVAALAGVPVIGLRVVADSLDRDLPDFNRALNPSGALDNRKALGIALRSPMATVRLLSANKRAMQRLSGAIELVLKAPCFS
jgi:nucleoside phosphorylase